MSAHGHHQSAPKEHPLVVVPDGAPFYKPPEKSSTLFDKLPLVSRRHNTGHVAQHFEAVAPERVFEQNTHGMEMENFQPEAITAGHLTGNTTVAFNAPEQNVYALIESSKESSEPTEALRIAHETLTTFWQEVEDAGEPIDKDNVEQHMAESLYRVRQALVNAGGDEKMSVGLTAVKLFRHGSGWGAAVAHAGNTTHGFVTNRNKKALHNNDAGTRTGQVIGLTHTEFDPHMFRPSHLQSSLNADPNADSQAQRIFTIPRLLKDSWIVLANDQVTGMSSPEHAQKSKVRDEALLDQRDAAGIPDPIQAANTLLNDRSNPEGSVIIVRLKEVVEAAVPEATAEAGRSRLSAKFRKMVELAARGAGLIKDFWESDDPKIKRRRHMVEVAGSIALAGALYYAGRRAFPDQVKGFEKKALDTKAKKKVGELAVKARTSIKQGKDAATSSKPAQKAVALGAKGKEKLATIKKNVPSVAIAPAEVVEHVVAAAPEIVTNPVEAVRDRASSLKNKAHTVRATSTTKGRALAGKLKDKAKQLPAKVAKRRS